MALINLSNNFFCKTSNSHLEKLKKNFKLPVNILIGCFLKQNTAVVRLTAEAVKNN